MNQTEHKASIEEAADRFQNHLDEKNNFRIIFSGKYGIGKSYFLNNFFDTRQEQYNKFLISPVNYAVSSNEDIFELIKVDLIMQLFERGMIKKESKVKISKSDKIQWFASNQPLHFFKFFSTAIKKISYSGIEIETDFLKAFIELKESYDKYTKKLEKEMNTDQENFESFLNSFSETTGNIYESNFITQLINEKLGQARESKKENILIIDDLDRIDPDHIFRIFNILSAHNNFFGEKNKFSFDKIILVCDIENIRRIFEHRYGKEVDFEGYTDKFYSTKIFKYSNTDAVGVFIHSLQLELTESDQLLLKYLLVTFLNNDLLTMRQLIKYRHSSPLENNILVSINFNTANHINNNVSQIMSFISEGVSLQLKTNHLSFLKLINICSTLFGEYENFIQALERLKGKRIQFLSFPLEAESAILESLAFPLHVSNALNSNAYQIFYALTANRNYNHVHQTIYPRVRISQFDFTFNFCWSFNQVYSDSNTDYFLMTSVSKSDHNGDRISDYVDLIYKIVSTFHKKKLLYLAKITSD